MKVRLTHQTSLILDQSSWVITFNLRRLMNHASLNLRTHEHRQEVSILRILWNDISPFKCPYLFPLHTCAWWSLQIFPSQFEAWHSCISIFICLSRHNSLLLLLFKSLIKQYPVIFVDLVWAFLRVYQPLLIFWLILMLNLLEDPFRRFVFV